MKKLLIFSFAFAFLLSCSKKQSCYTCKTVGAFLPPGSTHEAVIPKLRPDTIVCNEAIKSHYETLGVHPNDTAVTVTCK